LLSNDDDDDDDYSGKAGVSENHIMKSGNIL
jgi:hypothetical protein